MEVSFNEDELGVSFIVGEYEDGLEVGGGRGVGSGFFRMGKGTESDVEVVNREGV